MSVVCLSPPVIFEFLLGPSVDFQCKILLASGDSFVALSLMQYLPVFLWTCILEAPFYLICLRLKKTSWQRSFAILFFANLATHPLVTFAFPLLAEKWQLPMVYSALLKETFAPVVETLVIKKFSRLSWLGSIALSFAANLFSWWVGAYLGEKLFL